MDTLKFVLNLVHKDCYFAKIDIKNAFVYHDDSLASKRVVVIMRRDQLA